MLDESKDVSEANNLNLSLAEISLKQFSSNLETLFNLSHVPQSKPNESIANFYHSVAKSGNDLFDNDDNDDGEEESDEKKQAASTMGSLTVILTKLNYLLSIESVAVQVATINLFMLVMDKIRCSK